MLKSASDIYKTTNMLCCYTRYTVYDTIYVVSGKAFCFR